MIQPNHAYPKTAVQECRAALAQTPGRWWDIHQDGTYHEQERDGGSPYLIINRTSIQALIDFLEGIEV